MFGYCVMGSPTMATMPTITMRMEMTIATMGRFMKNLAMRAAPLCASCVLVRRMALRGVSGLGGRTLSGLGHRLSPCRCGFGIHRRRLHHGTSSHVLKACDDDPLARLESLVDDPEAAHTWPDLDRADLDRVVRPDHAHQESPLQVLHGPLGHEERAGPQSGGGAHFGKLAGTQQGLGIRKLAPDAEGPRREADVEVQGIEPPTVREDCSVGEDELEWDVLHPLVCTCGGRVVA